MSKRQPSAGRSKVDIGSRRGWQQAANRRRSKFTGRWNARLRPIFQELEPRTLLSGQPDLIISTATAPNSAVVGNGQTIDVNWTVTNQGGDITGSTNWDDSVYLSPTATYNASTAIQIDDETHYVAIGLNDGSSYSVDGHGDGSECPGELPDGERLRAVRDQQQRCARRVEHGEQYGCVADHAERTQRRPGRFRARRRRNRQHSQATVSNSPSPGRSRTWGASRRGPIAPTRSTWRTRRHWPRRPRRGRLRPSTRTTSRRWPAGRTRPRRRPAHCPTCRPGATTWSTS